MPDHRLAMTEPLRFGVFEIDPSARELRKHGVRIKLQDQPFAVLLILLEKPGQLVTREELQQRLWPADTFVEFDKGIYNAMKRLRETLCDEAGAPRYIETVPRHGYRFVASVQKIRNTKGPVGFEPASHDVVLTNTALGQRTIASPVDAVTEYRQSKRLWVSVGVTIALLSGLGVGGGEKLVHFGDRMWTGGVVTLRSS